MRIAFIPARGGSKRIPRKNIRDFHGQPIIAYSIQSAQQCGLFDKVIVSTDDTEIADIARQYGAEVPYMRPAQLADDHSTIGDVMNEFVIWLDQQAWPVTEMCLIFPTAPLLRSTDLIAGHALMQGAQWRYVIAATEYVFPIQRSFLLNEVGGMQMLHPEHFRTRSQDLPTTYHDAALFCWANIQTWRDNAPGFTADSTIHPIPHYRVIDLDTEDDWRRAELMYKVLKEFDGE